MLSLSWGHKLSPNPQDHWGEGPISGWPVSLSVSPPPSLALTERSKLFSEAGLSHSKLEAPQPPAHSSPSPRCELGDRRTPPPPPPGPGSGGRGWGRQRRHSRSHRSEQQSIFLVAWTQILRGIPGASLSVTLHSGLAQNGLGSTRKAHPEPDHPTAPHPAGTVPSPCVLAALVPCPTGSPDSKEVRRHCPGLDPLE